MSLAATSTGHLADVFEAWRKNQRRGAERVVKGKERSGGSDDKGYFHWLADRKDVSEVVELHKRLRRPVREETGGLG